MALPSADIPAGIEAVWRHLRMSEVCAQFTRPEGFETGWSLAGRIRGALGHALRRRAEDGPAAPRRRALWSLPSAFALMFEQPPPAPSSAGALFHNPTRPFVLFTEETGDAVTVRLRLFGWAALWAGEVAAALAEALQGGISVAPRARSRARLDPRGLEREEPRIGPPPAGASEVRLTFETPVCFAREGALAVDCDIVVSSLLARLAGVAAWHGMVPDGDWAALAAAEQRLRLEADGLRPVSFERFAVRQDRRVPMHGFLGTAVVGGDVGPFLPLLALAPWLHLGSRTSFGMGRCGLAVI